MTIEHANITDPNLHEPVGASTATAGQVYVADGAGSGNWIKLFWREDLTISPASVGANTTSEQTFTLSGLLLASDSIVSVSKPTHQTGLGIVGWRVSADDTIAITFMNNTGSPIVPTASQTYKVHICRS